MSVIDEIKQRLDIVELVGSYVPLQKAGQNYKGLCPFHAEKTPSFIVFPASQNWHCFGACSTGGDIFGFIMRRENMDFAEALRFLAAKAGIDLRPLDEHEIQQKDEADRLRALNVAAAQYYHHVLLETPQGEPGRRYLERRGVTRETMAAFQLGYAVESWHGLEEYLKRNHFRPEDILEAGLTIKNENGIVYDRFRGRLMFPIRDVQGHVIGFGGRVLDDSLPKYLNTPQTPLFDKGSVLYGIDLARQSIRESGTAIIVEGYMDVIIPHQCGVTNLIACMGTALTEEHLRILKPITKRLILAMDPDAAGMRAAERGNVSALQRLERQIRPVFHMQKALQQGDARKSKGVITTYEPQIQVTIHILELPDGLDPDELALHDRARWDHLVQEAPPVVDYYFRRVQAEVKTLKGEEGKREAVGRLLPIIATIDSPVSRNHYLQQLARLVRVDERDLWPELERLRRTWEKDIESIVDREAARQASVNQSPTPSSFGLEEQCITRLLAAPELFPEMMNIARLTGEAFQDVRNRQLFEQMCAYTPTPTDWEVAGLYARLDTELSAHVESLLRKLRSSPPLPSDEVRRDLLKCATRLRRSYLLRLISDLRFVLQDAQEQGDEQRVREVNEMIEQLTRERKETDQRGNDITLVGQKRNRSAST